MPPKKDKDDVENRMKKIRKLNISEDEKKFRLWLVKQISFWSDSKPQRKKQLKQLLEQPYTGPEDYRYVKNVIEEKTRVELKPEIWDDYLQKIYLKQNDDKPLEDIIPSLKGKRKEESLKKRKEVVVEPQPEVEKEVVVEPQQEVEKEVRKEVVQPQPLVDVREEIEIFPKESKRKLTAEEVLEAKKSRGKKKQEVSKKRTEKPLPKIVREAPRYIVNANIREIKQIMQNLAKEMTAYYQVSLDTKEFEEEMDKYLGSQSFVSVTTAFQNLSDNLLESIQPKRNFSPEERKRFVDFLTLKALTRLLMFDPTLRVTHASMIQEDTIALLPFEIVKFVRNVLEQKGISRSKEFELLYTVNSTLILPSLSPILEEEEVLQLPEVSIMPLKEPKNLYYYFQRAINRFSSFQFCSHCEEEMALDSPWKTVDVDSKVVMSFCSSNCMNH